MIGVIIILTIFIDQYTKFLATKYLKGKEAVIVIENFFRLIYSENRGAAFGILQDSRTFFIIITLLILALFFIFLYKNYNKMGTIHKITFALIIGGSIGNFIDRLRYGYVVDFLGFRLFNFYNFPNFNFADSFIVIGAFLMIMIILFDENLFLDEDI